MLRIALVALLLVSAATLLAPAASANDLVNRTCDSYYAEQLAFGCSPWRVIECVERFIGSAGMYC